jgi:hypothetical protein
MGNKTSGVQKVVNFASHRVICAKFEAISTRIGKAGLYEEDATTVINYGNWYDSVSDVHEIVGLR